ncbi:cytochrome aa3 quinol oxidase subunit IV [Bacillus gaemokensis]|uniref:Quinol oxidase subunit 4 n=1 Tax=Bacillus gaemokensis TaxID=574375 RepID=A0A073KN24_9BACI|nr:cytochrome aa3 quinol oxidase subunit IV [Bacillus gaemokensis]KEK23778.1 quinol oxidase subunit 4 [Bacillus gaemokensis]KYG38011.1 cytochrome aa3 quinol oxidase subunit IV [Bacillus gaemokensis]
MGQNNTQANGHAHSGFPWSHVFGFILSLALTFLALYVALYTDLPLSTILTTIIVMALAQGLLQLIMFMHLKEGEGRIQILTMIYSFFVAIATVGLTVWIFFSM